ncbi:MAG: hypothetical protein Q7T86_03970 [Hyphomicrobiaceae bacterium]|nr:hypothetical protein [Hyphomicrobiaceae bacterium]
MRSTNAIRQQPPTGRVDVSRFPASRLPELLQALAYLQQSATMCSVLRRLHASGNIVFVTYHPAHTKFLFHNPGNLRIQWNPSLGLQDVTGYLSPAMLLGHELGHAQFTPGERCAMLGCERPQSFQHEAYGVEEACVIATVEQPAARELNAARRHVGLTPLETANRSQHQLGRLIDVSGPLVSPAHLTAVR